jgi:hypothetical protein
MVTRSFRRPFGSALLAATLASCVAGPHQLRRTVDDWDHRLYVNSPWFDAALWIVPVIPVGHALAFVGDFLLLDAYAFWFHDAWDGAGTGFEHVPVQATDGRVGSLLLDRAGWTRVEK